MRKTVPISTPPNSSKAPKPNTRFLRNIIRETDSHNAALKAKEESESRARLRALRRDQPSGLFSYSDHVYEGLESAKSRKRRRLEDSDDRKECRDSAARRDTRPLSKDRSRHETRGHDKRTKHRGHSASRESTPERHEKRHRRKSDEKERSRHRRRRSDSGSEGDTNSRSPSRHTTRRHERSDRKSRHVRDRSRSDTRRSSRRDSPKNHRVTRSRSVSPYRVRSSKHSDSKEIKTGNRRRRSKSPQRKRASHTQASSRSVESSDSDPLEAIVGPAPPPKEAPVRSKGRGAFKASLAMDAHFAPNYDPSVDVRMNSDEEDEWGQAVEAFRDRVRWQQQGAERLRAAGFTDGEIRKWETGAEKGEEDVIWSKKGEGREWDRGKVLDEDGQIKLQADWGRLKGT